MPKWHFLFKHVAYKQSEWGKIQAAPSRSQENIERRVDSELPLPSVPMLNGSCSSIDAFLQDEKQSVQSG